MKQANDFLLKVFDLKRLDFKKCYNIQKHLVNKQLAMHDKYKQSKYENFVVLVEHEPPVYTIGLRKDQYLKSNALEVLKQKLSGQNFQIEMTDRGGLITFHGPGQLVAYPILNLRSVHRNLESPSLRKYVWQLEETVIDLCKRNFDLKAYRSCNTGYTGVWVDNMKVAALGVHCKRHITYHGLALNFDVDLAWFEHIVPCGITDRKVTSLSALLNKTNQEIKLNRVKNLEDLKPLFLDSFARTIGYENLVHASQEEVEDLKRVGKVERFDV